ncbi:thioredoxin family protein [Paludifilum halophilum]|uniref:Thioredoxin family protein n=1 Tax=Paludifilum halophilum TaxID=1642702 RepID=A0A235B3D2_9BACL|nr:thioredoxin family protein [Paludifilum halophilum]OYD06751.1 thioredoxin family protein [Paludifilum halophilum]
MKLKNLNSWFEKGMTGQAYIDGMERNRENLLWIYDRFHLNEGDRAFYRGFSDRGLRGIVLTADWCGDAMLCVPILMKIAQAAEIDLRYLIRDENLELMDRYLTNGKSRSIPIFIFIDRKGEEQAVWGPRAPEVQRLIDDLRAGLPHEGSPDFAEKQKAIYQEFKQTILADQAWWEAVNRSIRERLEERLIPSSQDC